MSVDNNFFLIFWENILYISCLSFDDIVFFVFNPLYSDVFSHTYKYNKDGIAHYIF